MSLLLALRATFDHVQNLGLRAAEEFIAILAAVGRYMVHDFEVLAQICGFAEPCGARRDVTCVRLFTTVRSLMDLYFPAVSTLSNNSYFTQWERRGGTYCKHWTA